MNALRHICGARAGLGSREQGGKTEDRRQMADKKAGRLGSRAARKQGAWCRMGRAELGVMGFALSVTFLCLPGY